MHRRLLIRSAAAVTLLPNLARGQQFPSKQLRILVGTPPGGGLDIVARILAQELTKSAGLSVLVENKTGGAGTVAVREMLHATPDGHTILLGTIGMLAVNPYAMKDAGYNPPTDMSPSASRSISPTCWWSIPACPPTPSPNISIWDADPKASTTEHRASAVPAISPASC